MRGETKRHYENREFYHGKSYGTNNINVNQKSSALFMFYNFPKAWGMGQPWMEFKKHGTVYDMYMVKKRLWNGQRYGFGQRGEKTEDAKNEGMNIWEDGYCGRRDDRKYSQEVQGMKQGAHDGNDNGNMGTKKTERDNNKNEMSHGVADEKKQSSDDVRVIDVMEAEIDRDTLYRGIIGNQSVTVGKVMIHTISPDLIENVVHKTSKEEEGGGENSFVAMEHGTFQDDSREDEDESDYGRRQTDNGNEDVDDNEAHDDKAHPCDTIKNSAQKENKGEAHFGPDNGITNLQGVIGELLTHQENKKGDGNVINTGFEGVRVSKDALIESNKNHKEKEDDIISNQSDSIAKDRFNKNWKVSLGGTYERRSFDGGMSSSKDQSEGGGKTRLLEHKENPDMIALQETKSNILDEWWMEDLWGSRNFSYVQKEANGRSGGLLLVWDNNIFTCKQAVRDERFIAVKGEWKGVNGDIFFVCIYGPNVGQQKTSLWNRLLNLMNGGNGSWCLFGDSNEVRCEDDMKNT
ncbi:RNA-directed DNA polymerase, eukaryota [Tanacetum coccineum]